MQKKYDLEIGNIYSCLKNVSPEIILDLYNYLSYEVKDSYFVTSNKPGWDGKIRLFKKRDLKFLSGLSHKVCSHLIEKFQIYPNIIDKRIKPNKNINLIWNDEKYKIREYQRKIIDICKEKSRAVIEATTGSGKCISEDSLCFTSEGILPISFFYNENNISVENDLKKINIKVINEKETEQSDFIYYDGIKKSIKIITKNGYTICGTNNHRIKVIENNKIYWKKLVEINKDDKVLIMKNMNLFGSCFFESEKSYMYGCLISGLESTGIGTFKLFNFNQKIYEKIINYFNIPKIEEKENIRKDLKYICIPKEIIENKIGDDIDFLIKKEIPISILKSNKESVTAFIRGIFEYNKTSNSNKLLIEINKNKLIKDIQTILLNFDIQSKTSNNILQIPKTNVNKFIKEFKINKKIKNINKLFGIFRNRKSLFCEKIQSIEKISSNNYDFVVPKNKSFIANGFINHNTVMVSKIIQELEVAPFIFYVLTKDLMYQAKDSLEDSIKNLKVGMIGDGICDIKDINVMTIQTATSIYNYDLYKEMKKNDDLEESDLKKLKEEKLTHVNEKINEIKGIIESANGIYFDECHHASAKTCENIVTKSINAYYRYGGSATPVRSDNAYMVIEGLFGRKTAIVTASDLIRKGYLMKPTIKFIKLKGRRVFVNSYAEDYKEHISENEERNSYIISLAQRLQEKNINCLILVNRIEHGNFLKENIDSAYFLNSKSKDRNEVIEKFKNNEIKTLICTSLADEGLDLPNLSSLIIAGGGKSPTKAKQRVGRVIRKGSQYSYVFDFMDLGKWTSKHSRKRKKILEQEEEFVVNVLDFEKINF